MVAWAAVSAGVGVVSAIGGFSSSRKAAKAARQAAQISAANLEKQRFAIREIATQDHESLMEQFNSIRSYNNAMAAFSGRSDRSIAALRQNANRLYGRDITRLREDEERNVAQVLSDAAAIRAGGQAQARQYRAQGVASLLTGVKGVADYYAAKPIETAKE